METHENKINYLVRLGLYEQTRFEMGLSSLNFIRHDSIILGPYVELSWMAIFDYLTATRVFLNSNEY